MYLQVSSINMHCSNCLMLYRIELHYLSISFGMNADRSQVPNAIWFPKWTDIYAGYVWSIINNNSFRIVKSNECLEFANWIMGIFGHWVHPWVTCCRQVEKVICISMYLFHLKVILFWFLISLVVISDTETLKYHKEFFIKLFISYLCLAIILDFCFSIIKHLFYLYLDESHRLVQVVLGVKNKHLSEDN